MAQIESRTTSDLSFNPYGPVRNLLLRNVLHGRLYPIEANVGRRIISERQVSINVNWIAMAGNSPQFVAFQMLLSVTATLLCPQKMRWKGEHHGDYC
jgi:hypothetical protein